MFGDTYIAQHIAQQHRKEQEHKAYQVYITDALKIIAENTANFAGGKSMSMRYYDLIKKDEPETAESAEEIKQRMIEKINKIGGMTNDSI